MKIAHWVAAVVIVATAAWLLDLSAGYRQDTPDDLGPWVKRQTIGVYSVTLEQLADEPEQRLVVAKTGQKALEISSYRIYLREPEGSSVTGGRTPQLVASEWSGGAHCCFTYHIIELGASPKIIQTIEGGHSDVKFRQLDGDPAIEIELTDWAFAYWPSSFADSPAPTVILDWDGKSYIPSADLMRNSAYATHRQSQPAGGTKTAIERAVDEALNLIYAGQWQEAERVLDETLPKSEEGQNVRRDLYQCRLQGSRWWPFIAKLNGVPATPAAEHCDKEKN
ncbi:MAG TPA: hypothetical protein VLL76_04310 [Candidatus Omnitrophota bacterium]|nr:hypothetical protein [Candidatus Omnitrophota bacterium]